MPQIGVGGAEGQLRSLVVGTNPCEVQHNIFYYSDSLDGRELDNYAQLGIVPTRIPRNKYRPLQFLNNLTSAISKYRPDIVQCWMVSGSFWGRLAAVRAGVRCIIVSHRSSKLERVWGLKVLEALTSNRVHYLANSHACARTVASRLRIAEDEFQVIHNGVDVQRFDIEPTRIAVFAELGIPAESRLVLTVARLTPAKDHDTLLRIALRCKCALPSVHFLLVGHGERELELRQRARKLDLLHTVHFMGLRNDVPRLLRSADVACLTSVWEGFPNSVLECMAAGLPIVTTQFAGVEELIATGVHGLTFPCGDDLRGFEAVQSCLEHGEQARTFGAAALARAASEFSMDAMIRKTVNYYRSLVGKKRTIDSATELSAITGKADAL